jgi:mono/diheme cytochrome c family protein
MRGLRCLMLFAAAFFAFCPVPASAGHGRRCYSNYCYSYPKYTYKTYCPPKAVVKTYPVTNSSNDNSVTYQYSYVINNAQPTTAQGATAYGYPSYSSADLYSNVDIGSLYNAAIRLASDSQQYGASATAGAQGLVGQLGQENARVAEILAKGHVAARVLREAAGPNELHTRQSVGVSASANVGPVNPNDNTPVPQPGDGDTDPPGNGGGDLVRLIQTKCISCHSASAAAGGLNLSDLQNLPEGAVDEILFRITGADGDPDKRMPLAPGSTAENPIPGEPLSVQELKTFFRASE